MPIAAGAIAPWVIWLFAGRIGVPELAAVSLASALTYLRVIWTYGEQEVAAQVRLGRRYTGPGPLVAFAVCSGLAGSLTAPGVSTFALVDAVGMAHVAGIISRDAKAICMIDYLASPTNRHALS